MNSAVRPISPARGFTARNLVSIDDLSISDIEFILNLSAYYATHLNARTLPPQKLQGHTQINLFFESSTRTNLSFELAGKKLGADVINVPVAASSVNKDEGLVDTAQTLAAMNADVMIVRHQEPHIHEMLARRLPCPIINAGDGVREHPTQALLDAATIHHAFGRIDGLVIAICGDIKHSRVAGSNARLLTKLGAKVRFVGPASLMPDAGHDEYFKQIECANTLSAGLDGADVVMGLRMQFERMEGDNRKEAKGYFEKFGLTHDTLKLAKPNAKIMHPGPMNRGVEIDGALADDQARSLVLNQVFHGVATRMACLDALILGEIK